MEPGKKLYVFEEMLAIVLSPWDLQPLAKESMARLGRRTPHEQESYDQYEQTGRDVKKWSTQGVDY
ncbi:hypothetical protein AAF712_007831 [Marasmius tenuissimus]|uniref:Uncharacterized protein n=1 Tax=Marasmius tenuissimus TaxID=585030 RepID=A0ABR2ZVP8_9AGAR